MGGFFDIFRIPQMGEIRWLSPYVVQNADEIEAGERHRESVAAAHAAGSAGLGDRR